MSASKQMIIVSLLIFCPMVSSFGQGGFGGLSIRTEKYATSNMLLFGGGGAWVISESFYLGGSGYGNINSIILNDKKLDAFGYGGLMLGYFKDIGAGFRLGSQLNVGSGGFSVEGQSGSFRFVEPNMSAWYSVTDFIHLNLSFNYRFAFTGANSILDERELSIPAIQLNLYVGLFK